MLAIFSGPSGAGKNTLINMLIEASPEKYRLMPTFTTRGMREGERQGAPYFFVSREEFLSMAKNGEFVEYEEVHGNFYGTSKKVLKEYDALGKVLLKDIDVLGAANLVERLKHDVKIKTIYITVSDLEELKARLKLRGETDADIERRFARVKEEEPHAKRYDKVIKNDDLIRAFAELKEFLG